METLQARLLGLFPDRAKDISAPIPITAKKDGLATSLHTGHLAACGLPWLSRGTVPMRVDLGKQKPCTQEAAGPQGHDPHARRCTESSQQIPKRGPSPENSTPRRLPGCSGMGCSGMSEWAEEEAVLTRSGSAGGEGSGLEARPGTGRQADLGDKLPCGGCKQYC